MPCTYKVTTKWHILMFSELKVREIAVGKWTVHIVVRNVHFGASLAGSKLLIPTGWLVCGLGESPHL